MILEYKIGDQTAFNTDLLTWERTAALLFEVKTMSSPSYIGIKER